MALKVPVFVVITKIDMCRKFVIQKTVTQLEKILKGPGCKKIPVRIESDDDAITAAQNFDSEKYALAYYISMFFDLYIFDKIMTLFKINLLKTCCIVAFLVSACGISLVLYCSKL